MKKSTTTAVDFIGGGEKYRTPMSVTKNKDWDKINILII